MALPAKIFRALLLAYPAEFRHEYGSEMEQVFADRLQSEPAPRVWLDAVADLPIAAPREHLHILKSDLQYAIRGMVLRQGIGLSALGVVIGTGGALALTRVLASSLYGVKATDPVTFYAVPVLILGVSAAACLIPAWKATRIDPAVALRDE